MRPGTIIYLNGSSSAGKSTVARALQDTFDQPFLDLGIDTLFGAVTRHFDRAFRHGSAERDSWRGTAWMLDEDERLRSIEFDDLGRRMVYGLHAMVAALAREGNDVTVDDVIFDAAMARSAARHLAPLPAYLVGVHCPLAILEEREVARGDRLQGLARSLHRRPHEHVPRDDVEVDTSAMDPATCAAVIRDHLLSGVPPSAFRLLAGA